VIVILAVLVRCQARFGFAQQVSLATIKCATIQGTVVDAAGNLLLVPLYCSAKNRPDVVETKTGSNGFFIFSLRPDTIGFIQQNQHCAVVL